MQTPDDSACWTGDWERIDPRRAIWAQSAVLRTVRALPELHPWRLGDDKGSGGRILAWCARREPGEGIGVFTQIAPPVTAEPDTGYPERQWFSSYVEVDPGVRSWAGALAQVKGSWLPPLAILPRRHRGFDDPGTQWSTESIAFAQRHTVHAANVRYAADLLAPHVTALILDHVPDDAAITISGDAAHVWWEYDGETRQASGKVRMTAEVTEQLVAALPSFVLSDHPDRSQQVEDQLAEKAHEAAEYRAARAAGRHRDPVMQRIYAQARAQYLAGGGEV